MQGSYVCDICGNTIDDHVYLVDSRQRTADGRILVGEREHTENGVTTRRRYRLTLCETHYRAHLAETELPGVTRAYDI